MTGDIRHRPAWQVNAQIRRAGSTQWQIAQAARCNQSDVSKVIRRRTVGTPLAERVWKAIEKTLNGAKETRP